MGETQQDTQDFGGTSIQELISKYLPYWPILVILMAIGATIAYYKIRKAVPIYQATASLLIKNNEQQGAIIQKLGGGSNYTNLENEMLIIRSKPVAREVVKELHLYAPIMQEGRVREDQSAYTTSPVVFRVPNPDSIKEVARVDFKYNAATKTVAFGGRAYPLNQWVSTPYGTMMMLPNPKVVDPFTLPMYFSLVSLQNMAGAVQGNLGLNPNGPESSLITLTYNDQSVQRGIDILNTIVNVYNRAAIDDKNKLSENTLRFLDERLKLVATDLDSIERRLQSFRASNRIVDVGVQGNQYLGNLNANDQQITNINLQLTVLDEVQRYLTSKEKNKEALIPAIGTISDPILSSQLQKLYTTESQRAALAATTGENYPSVTALTTEINTIRPTLIENLRNQRQNLLATRNQLNGINNRFNGLVSALPAQERELLNINRQQKVQNDIYTFLLQRREETALTLAATVSDSRLVNDAGGGGMVYPNVQSNYLQWIFSLLLVGVVFIFIKENLNRNVNSKAEVEKLTPTPIIAEIAHSPLKEAIVVEAGSRSLVAEQFRYLRTALSYVGINHTHRKILFTSSISGEGKSFVTLNLGATLALTGKKVVVLEMDLRKPKLSEMLGFDRSIGLSDYFIGAKAISEITKPTPINNLYLLSSGAIPPNPAELLLNGKLEELLLQLEASYDYVLVDTAPVSPVTDAYIISPLCDATLYVVRQGRTPRIMLQRLNDILRSKRLKNMSLIFNGVKQKRFGGYYGYGYTYGYGYLDEKKGKGKKKKGDAV